MARLTNQTRRLVRGTIQRQWRKAALAALSLLALGLGIAKAQEQVVPLPPPLGVQPTTAPSAQPGGQLPTVPVMAPRPGEAVAPNQQWQTQRMGPEQAPVASFIEPVLGNDAVIEVLVGQGRLVRFKADLAANRKTAFVAVGNPSIVDFSVLTNRLIRVVGLVPGVTDLSITTADGQTYSFEVRVLYDLDILQKQLGQAFPSAQVRLTQMRGNLVLEGEVRSPVQMNQIVELAKKYVESITPGDAGSQPQGASSSSEASRSRAGESERKPDGEEGTDEEGGQPKVEDRPETAPGRASEETRPSSRRTAVRVRPNVINLLRVPGLQQIMLQMRFAELNRTATRELAADLFGVNPLTGDIIGTAMGGGAPALQNPNAFAIGPAALGGITSAGGLATQNTTTNMFGVFPSGNFELMIRAMRRNQLLSILAEPNLMALNGEQANFLAGGQFPVPVAQAGGTGAATVTVEWKNYGVGLNFTPYIMENDVIRLNLSTQVSNIDAALSVTTVPGASPIPGLTVRNTDTVVELRQGQTLSISGMLQAQIDGNTSRIPGIGDLPYIGQFFSNNSHRRIEKELIVLVTPFLVTPMNPGQVPPVPGSEVRDPNDLEFYLLGRLESRVDKESIATHTGSDPLLLRKAMRLEREYMHGPVGFSE